MVNIFVKIRFSIFAILIAASFAGTGVAQTPPPTPPREAAPVRPGLPLPEARPRAEVNGTSERSIAVDPRINLSLCVTQGKVNVNGWNRNEVRVFIKDGSKIGFQIHQRNRQDQKPVWIHVVGQDPRTPTPRGTECIWGGSIEIDVPMDAAVSIKGKETTTVINSVRKASVRNVGGDVIIRNVTEGVMAATGQGDVAVENVDGAVALETSTGNILAADVGPKEVGDIFRAKTNSGAISLQRLEHRQVEVNSISGSVLFNSNFLSGGAYSFVTSNGSITLGLPTDSSAAVVAYYGFGDFNSELPLTNVTYGTPQSTLKGLSGKLGAGTGAKLTLTTTSGRIAIRKVQ